MYKRLLSSLFRSVDGGAFSVVYWDGDQETYGADPPRFTVHFRHKHVVPELFRDPVLGFGEGYMNGHIDFEGDWEEAFRFAHRNNRAVSRRTGRFLKQMVRMWPRRTSLKRQARDVQHHYDVGNEFYSLWLDDTMTYSCAYFHDPADSLTDAQTQKVDHTLRKLNLSPGQSLLDIGCGWGALIIRAAQQYGVRATGITLSKEQLAKGRQRIAELGIGDRVEIKLADYRTLAKDGRTFDRVVSVGMFEHVGRANHPLYLESVRDLMTPGGISVLHCITQPRELALNPWIGRYIFPGGHLPSLTRIMGLLPDYDFHVVDVESLRLHYAITLDRWARNFERHVDTVRTMYGERFVRMWRLYLRSCAVSFRVSGLDVHQIVFTHGLNNELPMTRAHLYPDAVYEDATLDGWKTTSNSGI